MVEGFTTRFLDSQSECSLMNFIARTRSGIAGVLFASVLAIPALSQAQYIGQAEQPPVEPCEAAIPPDSIIRRSPRREDRLGQCRALLADTDVRDQISVWEGIINQLQVQTRASALGELGVYDFGERLSVADRIRNMMTNVIVRTFRTVDTNGVRPSRRSVPLIPTAPRSDREQHARETAAFIAEMNGYFAAVERSDRLSDNVARKVNTFNAIKDILIAYNNGVARGRRRMSAAQISALALRVYADMDYNVHHRGY